MGYTRFAKLLMRLWAAVEKMGEVGRDYIDIANVGIKFGRWAAQNGYRPVIGG